MIADAVNRYHDLLIPELRGLNRVRAAESSRARLERRGRVPAGKRRRRR